MRRSDLDTSIFALKVSLLAIVGSPILFPATYPKNKWGWAWIAFMTIMLIWAERTRAKRSPRRWRALLCGQVGHSLPKRTTVDENGSKKQIDVACRRCDRVFQAPRICETCHQVTNSENV